VLIGWDASREATRAVSDAIPLLAAASTVTVMTVDAEKANGRHGAVPGAGIALYLARHGVRANVERTASADIGVGNVLAARCHIDLCIATRISHIVNSLYHALNMITAAQLRAARALLGVDQRRLAELSGLSVPTIQRMEASEGVIRGNVDSLMKLIAALDAAGIELIAEGAVSAQGGRGIRLKGPSHSP
jgi:DNA-binding transcriptional regulator YiaG